MWLSRRPLRPSFFSPGRARRGARRPRDVLRLAPLSSIYSLTAYTRMRHRMQRQRTQARTHTCRSGGTRRGRCTRTTCHGARDALGRPGHRNVRRSIRHCKRSALALRSGRAPRSALCRAAVRKLILHTPHRTRRRRLRHTCRAHRTVQWSCCCWRGTTKAYSQHPCSPGHIGSAQPGSVHVQRSCEGRARQGRCSELL
jgi:hypothetical protein